MAQLRLEGGTKKKYSRMLVMLCVVFGLTNSVQMVGVIDLINKGVIGIFCLAVLAFFTRVAQPRSAIFLLAVTGVLHAIAFAFPVSPKEGIATYFMFAFWILFWLYLASNIEGFLDAAYESRRSLNAMLNVWTFMTLVSFFLPFCYKVGWGGTRYFTSFTRDSFEIAPVAMFMLAVNILLFRFNGDRKRALLYAVVPLACVFAAGTRTYLVIVVVEFLILLRLVVPNNRAFAAVFAITLIVVFGVASLTNIGQKFESATLETDDMAVFLEVFTNGRSEFWEVDIRAYLESGWFNLLFGHGFSYVYDLNQQAVGLRLYAHNDFINVLLNFGAIGLVVYFAVICPFLNVLRKRSGGFTLLMFVFMWLFNAFFNMLYVYAVAVMAMGFLAAALITEGERYVRGIPEVGR